MARITLNPAAKPFSICGRRALSLVRLNAGAANSQATFQEPFQQPFPTTDSFPLFTAYSPTTTTTVYSVAPDFRPAMIQQYSLNLQKELYDGWLLEVGYVGTRGIHLMRQRSLNQALSASQSNPIRGLTQNTLANVPLRVPILGIPPDSLQEMESEGGSWYNGLEVSLTKRMSHGLQFLASYTFSKTLDTDGADINSTSSGNALTLGDQNSPEQRWGRASFDRTHRFVFSETWSLPARHPDSNGQFWRVGHRCCSYDSIWQCSHHLRHQCQKRFWDKRRPCTTQRHVLEKRGGDKRAG